MNEVFWTIRGGGRFAPAPFLAAGIVNLTPDPFSDGGRFTDLSSAAGRIRQVLAEGALLVDLGAESTRPGADDIGPAEEWKRLAPALRFACSLWREQAESVPAGVLPFAVCVDTFRAETARKALEAGAHIINDVSGSAFEPEMVSVVAEYGAGYVLGHSPARPKEMRDHASYRDVTEEILRHFEARMNALVRAGLPEHRIVLDPCIGFGKTLEHTKELIRNIPKLASLGRPLYFGVSRKSFLGLLAGKAVSDRDGLTAALSALLLRAGVKLHRVHDVAGCVEALRRCALGLETALPDETSLLSRRLNETKEQAHG